MVDRQLLAVSGLSRSATVDPNLPFAKGSSRPKADSLTRTRLVFLWPERIYETRGDLQFTARGQIKLSDPSHVRVRFYRIRSSSAFLVALTLAAARKEAFASFVCSLSFLSEYGSTSLTGDFINSTP